MQAPPSPRFRVQPTMVRGRCVVFAVHTNGIWIGYRGYCRRAARGGIPSSPSFVGGAGGFKLFRMPVSTPLTLARFSWTAALRTWDCSTGDPEPFAPIGASNSRCPQALPQRKDTCGSRAAARTGMPLGCGNEVTALSKQTVEGRYTGSGRARVTEAYPFRVARPSVLGRIRTFLAEGGSGPYVRSAHQRSFRLTPIPVGRMLHTQTLGPNMREAHGPGDPAGAECTPVEGSGRR